MEHPIRAVHPFGFRATLSLLALCALACAGADAERPRNLLLISLDTLRADHLGSYGYPRPTSPFLDRLATEGVLFERAVATSPWTLPSHASIFTGFYPSQHGATHENLALPKELPTLAEQLRGRGFATAGVVSGFFLGPRYGVDRGFDRYVRIPSRDRSGGASTSVNTSASVTASGLAWLDGLQGQTYFLFLHYFDVHSDYRPEPRFEALFASPYAGRVDGSTKQMQAFARGQIAFDAADRARLVDLYDAEIRQLDEALAGLFAQLRARGLLDDTLVIVTADHGEEFFERGGVLHSFTQYQEMLHVPLIFAGPGVPRGLRVDEPVSLVDLAPTALSLLGVAAGPASAGRDLAPLWQDPDAAWPERSLFAEANLLVGRVGPKRAIVRGRWKLVQDPRSGERELYDLDSDPLERVNRAAAEPELAASLANDLALSLAEQREAPALPRLTHAERAQLQALGYERE